MNFFENRGGRLRRKANREPTITRSSHTIVVKSGHVHEAIHYMHFQGEVDMSQLDFFAEPIPDDNQANSVQSFLDIAIFEVPEQCTSETCDISKYGVGKRDDFQGSNFVNLCDKGRLVIDTSTFEGLHTQLIVPLHGPMPKNVKKKKAALLHKDQTYNILFANCNTEGRNVYISGQVVLDYNEHPMDLSFQSVMILVTIALSICSLFTVLSVRVHSGTRADYQYERFQPEVSR
jgi:hypothetical protein